MTAIADPVLSVEDLHVEFPTSEGVVRAVDGVSLSVGDGEAVGLVGESGCGKSVLALSILGLVPEPGEVVSGRVLFRGRDLSSFDAEAMRKLRGGDLAISFQDARTALNPLMRIGSQVRETMAAHDRWDGAESTRQVVPVLKRVGIAAAFERAGAYPHELSGGMRQRVMIGIGVANDPELLIADEATTGLDATAQADMVQLLRRLNTESKSAVLLITHNMALLASLCQRVVVMYAGRIVEEGPVEQIFARPQHPYTWQLLRSIPRIDVPRSRLIAISGSPPDLADTPAGCAFHPRCPFALDVCTAQEPPLADVAAAQKARCWVLMMNVDQPEEKAVQNARGSEPLVGNARWAPVAHRKPTEDADADVLLRAEGLCTYFCPGARRGVVKAVDGVSLELRRGETLGLIGESGCGKTSLIRTLALLIPATTGRLVVDGQTVNDLRPRELRRLRSHLQVVFQDPFASLDPRMTVEAIIAEPLHNFGVSHTARRDRIWELLDLVGLRSNAGDRYPHELSGGQRQRVGIARALALDPQLLLCDEPVSSLDVSVQAQVINLLMDLQQHLDLTYLFVSHDLGVIRHVADRVAVMYQGKVVETADADEIYAHPQHPYTAALLASTPVPLVGWLRQPTPSNVTQELGASASQVTGCHYHPRCRIARAPGVCDQHEPPLAEHGTAGHASACHFAAE